MLAQLLAQYALRRDPDMDVIWVNGWSLEEVEDSGGHFSYLEKKGWALDRNTLFIFDDAQASFKDTYLCGGISLNPYINGTIFGLLLFQAMAPQVRGSPFQGC